MRTFIIVLCQVAALTACTSGNQSAPSVASPAQFEIRDFKVVKAEEEGRNWLKGRGTLITKDPRLTAGSFMVWLSVKKGHQEDREQRYAVVLADGVGNLETRDYFSPDELLVVKPEFKGWRVLGYVPLLPAQLTAPAAERAASR